MLTLPPSVKIFIAAAPVRMSKSFDGLANAAREVVLQDPLSGHLFVFFNRTRTQVKAAHSARHMEGATLPALPERRARCRPLSR